MARGRHWVNDMLLGVREDQGVLQSGLEAQSSSKKGPDSKSGGQKGSQKEEDSWRI